jgi:hypothetical protein
MTQLRLIAAFVGLTGRYNNVHVRPYISMASDSALDELADRTRGGSLVSENTVTLEHNDPLLRPAGESSRSHVNVNGGWGSTRNVLFMIIDNINNGSRYIISGYTSPDFMQGRSINPNCTITFNSVMELKYNNISNEYNIVNSDYIQRGFNFSNNETSYRQRPVDILGSAHIRKSEYFSRSDIGNLSNNRDDFNIAMTSSMLESKSVMSDARNSIPSNYLSRSISAVNNSRFDSDNSIDDNLYGLASNDLVVKENSYSEHELINELLIRSLDIDSSSCIWSKLVSRVPGLNPSSNILRILENDGSSVDTDNHNIWNNRNQTTYIASQLSTAVTSLMMAHGISSIDFTVSTSGGPMDDYGNSLIINKLDDGSTSIGMVCEGMNEEGMIASFINHLRSKVFPSITRGHDVVATISCNIFKDIAISIRVDGVVDRFASPSFASSCYQPVLTNDLRGISELSINITKVNDSLGEFNGGGPEVLPDYSHNDSVAHTIEVDDAVGVGSDSETFKF